MIACHAVATVALWLNRARPSRAALVAIAGLLVTQGFTLFAFGPITGLGMLVTLAWLPLSLAGVAIGFVLFRVLDVVKPFPVGRLERAPRGWGIILDDAMAGVYGQLVLRACVWAFPAWMAA